MALRDRQRERLYADLNGMRRGRRLRLVVAAIALLGLGVWIGRASQPDQQPAPPGDVSAGGEAPIDWPGPTRTENGVPVGYDRSEAGAVAAAVNYDQTWSTASGDRLGEILDVIAADDARDRLRAGIEAGRREAIEGLGLDPSDPDFAARMAYGGYAVDAYTPEAATVRLWAAGHFVDPQVGGVNAGWGTTTMQLAWEDGDWRVDSWRTADGPTSDEANRGDPRRVGRAMNEFEGFWYVPR